MSKKQYHHYFLSQLIAMTIIEEIQTSGPVVIEDVLLAQQTPPDSDDETVEDPATQKFEDYLSDVTKVKIVDKNRYSVRRFYNEAKGTRCVP